MKDFCCLEQLELTMKEFEKTSKQHATDQEELVLVNNSRVSHTVKDHLLCFRSSPRHFATCLGIALSLTINLCRVTFPLPCIFDKMSETNKEEMETLSTASSSRKCRKSIIAFGTTILCN